nr:unnamed protein product [Callosobruchus analis]
MHYPREELVNMIYIIGECLRNCLLALRVHAHKYPNDRHRDGKMLQALKERFDRTGNVAYEKKSRAKRVLNKENQLAVCLSVVENSQISVR